jgi:Na+-driven multidrug efflux pump
MMIGLYGIFVVNRDNLPVSFKGFRPDLEIMKDILAVGVPSALTQATTSVVSGIINKLIAGYGAAAIAVFGGFNKISSFGTLPIFGVTRGMNPILGYSAGAKDSKRFIETRNLAVKYASVFSVITGLVFALAPGVILKLLSATPEMGAIGMQAYRIMGFPIMLYGASIVLSQQFPPAKKSYITMLLTIARQVGYMVPLCILFSRTWGLNGIWAGYAAADIINFFVVLIVSRVFRRKVLETWVKNTD